MIRAVIIEDEAGAMKVLESLLEEYLPEVQVVGTANSVEDGIRVVRRDEPALVFLDIRLPDGDGFEVLERTKDLDFEVIFTTAYGEYREKAFDYFALHYLTKPIDIDKLEAAVNSLKDRGNKGFNQEKYEFLKQFFDNKVRKLALPTRDGYVLVNVDDIARCEAQANYTEIFMKDGKKHLITRNLKYYEDLLEPFSFYRIHRSHLVNTNFIKEVKQEGTVIMQDNQRLSISQRAKKAFLKFLEKLS